VLLLLVAVGFAGISCRRRKAEPAVPQGTPVILISIDTLRADRLPAYGYAGVATPAIDSLRADSILFRHAFTHVPLTLPAHVSLLTGLYPPEHGVRDNAGYRLRSEGLPYLPAMLKELGYKTGAAVSAFVLRASAGLDAGFDFYDDRLLIGAKSLLSDVQRDGLDTLAASSDWLRSVAREPFFFFFHIYEPHMPHTPPEPFASRYESAYDGEVAAADAVIGELLQELKRLGVYESSIVILISDHGEGLYDHGDLEHGLLLYRESLQVPLLLKLPFSERGGATVDRPVGLIDIVPTLAPLLGAEIPADLPGRSLLDEDTPEDQRPLYAETFFPRFHFRWSELFSIIDYPYHYIQGPDPELYDLENDPQETNNILREDRRVLGEMRRHLEAYEQSFVPPSEEDAATRQKLAALGYLGSTTADADGELPDPKSQLATVEKLKVAFEDYAQGRYQQAAEKFESILETQPQLVDAWEQLGHARMAIGQPQAALEAFERAMEFSGGSPTVAGAIATVLLKLGRFEEARKYAELALDGHEQSRDTLAQICIRQGDLETAEPIVQEALARRGSRIGPLVTAAELRFSQGRLQEALVLTDQALDEFGDRTDWLSIRGLHYLRGSTFARLGQLDAAARSFSTETDLFPTALEAYANLARVYALQRQPAESRQALYDMVERNPTPQAYASAVGTLRELGETSAARELLNEARTRWPRDASLAELG
jgi:arylsulfatase A-like enzyme/Tfp pilus assembly protein PilF